MRKAAIGDIDLCAMYKRPGEDVCIDSTEVIEAMGKHHARGLAVFDTGIHHQFGIRFIKRKRNGFFTGGEKDQCGEKV